MSGDWARKWKPQFDQRIASLFEMYDHEMGDASFNTPHQEMESASFHAAHNPTQVGADWPVLEKGSGWYLSLTSQRRLPRYLSAITLFSEGNRVTGDHFEYWRCTGAYASLVSDLPGYNREQIMETLEDAPQLPPDLPGSRVRLSESMLNDLCLLLQLAVLGDQTTEVKMPEYGPSHSEMDPILERLVTNWATLATTHGFPVLEGLLKEQRGEPNDEDTSFFWSLKEWVEQIAYLETKETVVETDKLHEIDASGQPEEVTLAMDELVDADSLIGNDHLIKSNVGLLWDLRGRRNDAQHRNQMVRGVAVVIVTLCCLVFWNAIGQEEFQSLRQSIRAEANRGEDWQQEIIRRGEFYPEAFYDSPPRFARLMSGMESGDTPSN
jgi:hypothetical protein